MRIINASETGTLVLGFQGEDQRLEIRFPLVDEKTGRNITEEFPGGSFSISIMLPGDPAEHIVGNEDFRIEGNWLIWTVKEAYTVGFGEGKLQLNYAFAGMAKSKIWKTSVRKSISSGAGTVPSWSDWKTELLTAAAAVQSAVDSYDEMTAEAEDGDQTSAHIDRTGDHPVLQITIKNSGGSGGGAVQSVNGKTGAVVLNANDVGALPASTPIPPAVTVDSELSGTSTNPVQNKVIKAKLDEQSETIVNLRSFVTPEEYGAVGDGVTDDAEAIQDAINAGSKVVFKKKTYLVGSPLDLHDNLELDFNGASIVCTATKFLSAEAAWDETLYTGAYAANSRTGYSTGTGLVNVRSSEQVHDGRSYYTGGMTCFSTDGRMNCSLPYSLTSCTIYGQSEPIGHLIIRNIGSYTNLQDTAYSTASILLRGVHDVLIENCDLSTDNRNYIGIQIERCSNITIRDCVIGIESVTQTNTYGIDVAASSYTTVERCRMWSNKWHCITTGSTETNLHMMIRNCVMSLSEAATTTMVYGDHGNTLDTKLIGCTFVGNVVIADGTIEDCEFKPHQANSSEVQINLFAWVGDKVKPNFTIRNIRSAVNVAVVVTLDNQDLESDVSLNIDTLTVDGIVSNNNRIALRQSAIPNHVTAFDYEKLFVSNFVGKLQRMQVFKTIKVVDSELTEISYAESSYDSMIDYTPELMMVNCVSAEISNAGQAIRLQADNCRFADFFSYGTVLPAAVLLANCINESVSDVTAKASVMWLMTGCRFASDTLEIVSGAGGVNGTNLSGASGFPSDVYKAPSGSSYFTKSAPNGSWSETPFIMPKRVGGKIYYIDSTATGATYHFYDQDLVELDDVQIGDEPYYYSVVGTPDKDKYYVVSATDTDSKQWSYNDGGSVVITDLGLQNANIGDGKTNTAAVMAAASGAYVDSTDTIWHSLAEFNQTDDNDDWYIISQGEILALYEAQDRQGNPVYDLTEDHRWTSTEGPHRSSDNSAPASMLWRRTTLDCRAYDKDNRYHAVVGRSF